MAGLAREDGSHRLQVDQRLAAESAADLHGDGLDPGDGNAGDEGHLITHVEVALAAAPDGDVAVRPPVHGGGVRLDVALMHRLGAELALDDYVGVLEALLDVAHLEKEMVGDVGAVFGVAVIAQAAGPHGGVGDGGETLVEDGGIGFHRLQHVGHRIQHLVLDLDEFQGLLGDVGAGGGDGSHGVPLVQHLLGGQAVVAQELGIDHGSLGLVADAALRLGQVGGGDHAAHTLHRLGLAGVNGLDAGVSVRAAKHPGMEQSRQVNVCAVAGAARHLFCAVLPDGPSSYHVVFLVGEHDVCACDGGHGYIPPEYGIGVSAKLACTLSGNSTIREAICLRHILFIERRRLILAQAGGQFRHSDTTRKPFHLYREPEGEAAAAVVEAVDGRAVKVVADVLLDAGAGAGVHHVAHVVYALGYSLPGQFRRVAVVVGEPAVAQPSRQGSSPSCRRR